MRGLNKVKVGLRPILNGINLPTVLKTAILPGDSVERLFIASQVGEIFFVGNGDVRTFLDIRQQVLDLGTSNGGYDERGLLGLAFHPQFYYNGLFYLHYSVAGTQGPGAPHDSFEPDHCDPNTLNLQWKNRETEYDHIDTVEEWIVQSNGQPTKRRTLLNLRRPFYNHNGVNSLNFSPETGKLVLTTGDGGSGFDPFNLAQKDLEIAGKIIEIDVSVMTNIQQPPAVTRFSELPLAIQETLTVTAKGVRNIPGISYQRNYNHYIKYVGQVGQALIESIFAYVNYKPIPVTQLVQASITNTKWNQKGFINLGWRGWEGNLPTPIVEDCSEDSDISKKTIAFYNEAIKMTGKRLQPLTSYYHEEPRSDKFGGTALTGVQAYIGNDIPALTGSVVFTDFARKGNDQGPSQGFLGYTKVRRDSIENDYSIIETDYDFGDKAAHYTSLGTNLSQTKLYLGVYGSMRVTDYNQGSVFEIVGR